jgi:hypothetical protein
MSASAQQVTQLALPSGAIAPLVIGICIVLVLVGGVWIGVRRREPPVPPGERPRARAWQTREEHDRGAPPDHGPGNQGDGTRSHESRRTEPDVMPADGRRRLPHEVHDSGVHAGKTPAHPRRHSGPNID